MAKWMLFSLMGVLTALPRSDATASEIPEEFRIGGFAIGCQSYSFNRFTVFEAIEKTAEAGGRVIEFYPGQRFSSEDGDLKLDHDLNDAALGKLKEKLEKHGVKAVNYGVVWLGTDEEHNRRVFEFAKKMGIGIVTSEPDVKGMDGIEKLVKEYDIKLAIHNHPSRENKPDYRYWDPEYVLSMVEGRDRRMGVCADTGHWIRSGVKPLEALRLLKGRIVSAHLKDLNKFDRRAHDVPYGTGITDVGKVLEELERQKFKGNISIEYEHNWDHSVPEIAQCIGFVRGWAAAED